MLAIQIIFLAVFIILSPLFGFLLAKYTKEEQKAARIPLSVAFVVVFSILFALILINSLYIFYLFLFSLIMGVMLSFFIRSYLFFLGIIFFLSLGLSDNFVFVVSSFVFLLNLILGCFYYQKSSNLKHLSLELLYFISPVLVYLASINLNFDTTPFLAAGIAGVLSLMLNQKSNKYQKPQAKKR